MKIPQLEARGNDLADNALADGVIERPLQAVPHLDAQRPVVLGDDKDDTVIHFSAPQFPLLRDAQGILLDRFRLGSGNDEDRDLAAFTGFKRLQSLFQAGLLICGERRRLIGDARGQGRNWNLRSGQESGAKRYGKK